MTVNTHIKTGGETELTQHRESAGPKRMFKLIQLELTCCFLNKAKERFWLGHNWTLELIQHLNLAHMHTPQT